MKAYTANGIVKQRKQVSNSVNNLRIKVTPHPRSYAIRRIPTAYWVTPITEIVDEGVTIRYIVINGVPLSSVECGIMPSGCLVNEYGEPAGRMSDMFIRDNMRELSAKVLTCNRKTTYTTYVGLMFEDSADAIEWSKIIARQLSFHNEIARRKMTSHILKLRKLFKSL